MLALKLKILLRAHLFNPFWKSREERRRIRGEAVSREVCNYVSRRYLKGIHIWSNSIVEGRDRVYTMWLGGKKQTPKLIRNCIKSMQENLDQEVVVLTEKNIFNWITLPEDIIKLYLDGKMRPCHFADICRVELLYEHGGYWMDATCYVSGKIPQVISDSDFFVYMAGNELRGSYSYIQNCFIRAKRGSALLAMWRDVMINYWRNETDVADYFVHQLLFKALVTGNPSASELFAAMPKIDQTPTHLAWYKWGGEEYDAARLSNLANRGFFFQKTSYKDRGKVKAGSYRDHMLNC